MRHYEIVFIVHPDQSGKIQEMLKKYTGIIETDNGKIHRLEDWGRGQLAYPIKKLHKAHYILMNVECRPEALNKITNNFRVNDFILRHHVLKCDEKITTESHIMKMKKAQATGSDTSGTRPRHFSRPRPDGQDAAKTTTQATPATSSADKTDKSSKPTSAAAQKSSEKSD